MRRQTDLRRARNNIEIQKVESNAKVEAFIEAEQEKYETQHGISCQYTPFCFVAKVGDEIIGAVTGARFFSEVYIDELVVKEGYRGKGIGTQLIQTVEVFFNDQGLNNISHISGGFFMV